MGKTFCFAAVAALMIAVSADAYEYIKSGWPVSCAVSVAPSDPVSGAKVAASVSGFVDPFDGLELGYLRTDFSEALSKWFRTTPPQGISLFLR